MVVVHYRKKDSEEPSMISLCYAPADHATMMVEPPDTLAANPTMMGCGRSPDSTADTKRPVRILLSLVVSFPPSNFYVSILIALQTSGDENTNPSVS